MANSWLQLKEDAVIRGKLLLLQSSGETEQLKGLREFATKPRGKGQTFGNVMLATTHTHTQSALQYPA